MGDRCNCPPFFDRDIESDINDLLGRSELVVLRAVKSPNLEKSFAVFDNRFTIREGIHVNPFSQYSIFRYMAVFVHRQ